MDKILFLDIDGVLNNSVMLQKHAASTTRAMGLFDPVAVEQLDRVIRVTGCKVVLSSTWRLYGIDSIHEPLDNSCIGHNDRAARIKEAVFDRTPDFFKIEDEDGSDKKVHVYSQRGDEIQKWIDDNNFKGKFVIVDDDSDMAHLMDHLVQTTFDDGLTKEKADEIINKLGEAPTFSMRGH